MHADIVRAACSTCPSGKFASAACTTTSDTVCSSECSYVHSRLDCRMQLVPRAGQVISHHRRAPRPLTPCARVRDVLVWYNDLCVACGTCSLYHYAVSACTPTTNTVCQGSARFVSPPKSCAACSTCQANQYMCRICTANADSVCSGLLSMFFELIFRCSV